MTRRDFVLKWLLYALALLPVLVLNLYVFPRFPLRGTIPTLLPLAAITVAVLEGPAGGAGFGLFVGILSDALIPGLSGPMTFVLCFLGLLAGIAARYGVRQNLLGCLICSSTSLFLINLIKVLFALIRSYAPLLTLTKVVVPEIIWSLVFLPLIYVIFLWVYRRVPQASSVL